MSRPSILIAEDDEIGSWVLKEKLTALGYDVPLIAGSEEETVVQARRLKPSLILMDVRLSEGDGVTAARRILAEMDVAIVYLTAHADDATVQRSKGVGIYGYLVKPYDDQGLRIAIDLALYKHETERRLRALNVELEQRVDARMVELKELNARLQVALHEASQLAVAAQAANQAKSDFLAMMSHETRTPLSVMLGALDLLKATALTGEQHDLVETSRTSGDVLMALLTGILEFSGLETGQGELRTDPIDPRRLVEGVLESVAEASLQKGIDVLVRVEPSVPAWILSDGARMRQMLTHLVSNAVKFTETGSVWVEVDARHPDGHDAPEQRELHFQIHDTGVGITPEQRERIFDLFSQGNTSLARSHGGVGLGLPMVRRLVSMMGGRIWFASEGAPGRGSTFHVALPLLSGDNKTLPYPTAPHARLRGRKVLLLDERPARRAYLASQMNLWGLDVEASHTLSTGAPYEADVWVVDEANFARQPAPSVPCLVLAPLAPGSDSDRILRLGLPLKPSRLYRLLLEACPVSRSSRDSGPSFAPFTPPSDTSLRLLVVEDNALQQKLLILQLKRLGYRADVVNNGREAVEAVSRQPYDVVLMDLQMPEMDGLEATLHIRRMTDCPQPRIIAVTANNLTGDRERCLEAGMDDFLAKPVSPESIVRVLSQLQEIH